MDTLSDFRRRIRSFAIVLLFSFVVVVVVVDEGGTKFETPPFLSSFFSIFFCCFRCEEAYVFSCQAVTLCFVNQRHHKTSCNDDSSFSAVTPSSTDTYHPSYDIQYSETRLSILPPTVSTVVTLMIELHSNVVMVGFTKSSHRLWRRLVLQMTLIAQWYLISKK